MSQQHAECGQQHADCSSMLCGENQNLIIITLRMMLRSLHLMSNMLWGVFLSGSLYK